jgi:hypothetical protein
MKEYKKWLKGIRTLDLQFEKESMEWVSTFGSTDEVKTTAKEKVQCVLHEIMRREGFVGVS